MLAASAAVGPGPERLRQMFGVPGPAAGDHRDADGIRHRRGHRQIVPVLRAVRVHRREDDFAGPEFLDAPGPRHRFQPGRIRPPLTWTSQSSRVPCWTRCGSMFTTVAQRPNFRATSAIRCGFFTAAELTLTFSAPAWISRVASSSVRMPPPTVNGMKICFRDAPDHVQHDVPPLVAGGDVEENQFVGAICLVAAGHFHRIAGVAQLTKVDALHDPAAVHVQARNDPLAEHSQRP